MGILTQQHIIVYIAQHLHITIIIIITGTGADISIDQDQQHIHTNHTRRINQLVDMSEVINQLAAGINQLADQVQGRELEVQELVVQEQVRAADANTDRKIKNNYYFIAIGSVL